MKKILVVGLFGALILASCKKDRTCVLTKSDGAVIGTKIYSNMTKSDALDACEAELKNAQNSVVGSSFKDVTAKIK